MAVAPACEGYLDLPFLQRENAQLEISNLSLFPGAMGLGEIRLQLPEDVTGEVFVVSAPYVRESLPLLVNWAAGPCSPSPASHDENVSPDTFCMTLYQPRGFKAASFSVEMVVEERATARRFSVLGEAVIP